MIESLAIIHDRSGDGVAATLLRHEFAFLGLGRGLNRTDLLVDNDLGPCAFVELPVLEHGLDLNVPSWDKITVDVRDDGFHNDLLAALDERPRRSNADVKLRRMYKQGRRARPCLSVDVLHGR